MIDALIATGTGAVTQGKGFWFTEVASITGAYVRAKLQDKDPLAPVAGAAIGNIVGSTGSKIITAGNQLKPIISNKTSNLTGAILGAGASEIACSEVQKQLEAREGKR
ncbi:hypothetical protein [Photorhabdus australis]|uniref:hypothetical protein n=1 Tax=Photorhabdus australis TaxID=286156 RepID=UPI000A7891B9